MDGVPFKFKEFFRYAGKVATTLFSLIGAMRPPFYFREWFRIIASNGAKCMLPVFLVLGAFGAVVAIQGLFIFQLFNMERLLGSLLLTSFQKELGPVLTGVIVAVQTGSTLSAELGTMRVREQIDAFEVMALDPVRFLYLPRFMTPVLLMPLLSLAGGAVAVISGVCVTVVIFNVDYGDVIAGMFGELTMMELLWGSVIKSATFGVIIGLLAVHHGSRVTGGSIGVGRAANLTVVHSIILLFLFNSLWSNLLFGALH